MKISVPRKAKEALQLIEESGYQAYIVGGTVRDLLLAQFNNNPVNFKKLDIDIATNARPETIKQIFKGYKQFYAGIRHGTVGVFFKGIKVDITTFRVEGSYSDGRRPDSVKFVSDLQDDLARRDFTINAMAADLEGNILDPFSGLKDLQNKVIRAVGDPIERFEEDSLRMVRAIRFAAKLGFEIEKNTLDAIKTSFDLIKKHQISLERIYVELQKTFETGPSKGIHYLNQSGLTKVLFPETSQWCHTLEQRFQDLLDSFDDETIFALLYFTDLFSLLKIDETFSDKNIERISNFYLKRYPGIGKWKSIRIAMKLILLNNAFALDDAKASKGEIRRWLFKPWYYFSMKQKDFAIPLLEDAKNALEIMGRKNGNSYFKLNNEFDQTIDYLNSFSKPINGDDLKKIGLTGRTIGNTLKLISMLSVISMGAFDPETFLRRRMKSDKMKLADFRKALCVDKPTFSPDEDSSLIEWFVTELKIRLQLGNLLTVVIGSDEQKRTKFLEKLNGLVKIQDNAGIQLISDSTFHKPVKE